MYLCHCFSESSKADGYTTVENRVRVVGLLRADNVVGTSCNEADFGVLATFATKPVEGFCADVNFSLTSDGGCCVVAVVT